MTDTQAEEQAHTEEQAQAALPLATFADLEDRLVVNFEVERPGGGKVIIPLRELTYSDWLQAEFEYPRPQAPIMGSDAAGRPLLNFGDPAFVKASAECEANRSYSRLLLALQLDIPGDTREDKIARLHKIGSRIVRTLTAVLNDMHSVGEARVADHAATFQPNGAGPAGGE